MRGFRNGIVPHSNEIEDVLVGNLGLGEPKAGRRRLDDLFALGVLLRLFPGLLAGQDEVMHHTQDVQQLLDLNRVVRGIAIPDAAGVGLGMDRPLQGREAAADLHEEAVGGV